MDWELFEGNQRMLKLRNAIYDTFSSCIKFVFQKAHKCNAMVAGEKKRSIFIVFFLAGIWKFFKMVDT